MRSNLDGSRVERCRMHANKLSIGVLDDAEVTLTFEHPTVLIMTPTAARDINLPDDDDANYYGQFFIIQNGAAATHPITLKNEADGTVGTLDATQTALVFLDPTGVWRALVASNT